MCYNIDKERKKERGVTMYKVMLPDTLEIDMCDFNGFIADLFIYNEYDFILNDDLVWTPVITNREFSERTAKWSIPYLR